jgi:hypothetical protein
VHADPRHHRDRDRGEGEHRQRAAMPAAEPHEALARRVVVRRHELTGEEPPDVLAERTGVGIAVDRIELERLGHDRHEVRRRARRGLGERLDVVGARLVHDLGRAHAGDRRQAREQLVEHRAERVDIALQIGRLAARLLGRHEAGRTEHRADLRAQRLVVAVVELAVWRVRLRAIGLADDLREAPVDDHGLAVLADEDVRGLEIAVDHAALVGMRHGIDRREHRR